MAKDEKKKVKQEVRFVRKTFSEEIGIYPPPKGRHILL